MHDQTKTVRTGFALAAACAHTRLRLGKVVMIYLDVAL